MEKYSFILTLSSLVLSVSLDSINENGNNVSSKIELINVDDNVEKIITLNETESQNINKSDIDLNRDPRSAQFNGDFPDYGGVASGYGPGNAVANYGDYSDYGGRRGRGNGRVRGGRRRGQSVGRRGGGGGGHGHGGGVEQGGGGGRGRGEGDGTKLRCGGGGFGGNGGGSAGWGQFGSWKKDCTWDEYVEYNKRKSEARYEEYWKRIYETGMADEADPLTQTDLNGRLVAYPGEYRHMAVIGLMGPDRKKIWKCGGTLIDFNFVLTAAHCTDFGGIAPTNVKIGDINLRIREGTVSTQRMRVHQIYVHPKYRKNSLYNDIALIRLSKPAVWTRHVRPARLWAFRDYPVNIAYALGYGATKFGRANLDVLTFLNMTMINNEICKASLASFPEAQNGIIDSQMCAMDFVGNADTCQGDSGGPLQLHLPGRRKTKYYIIGITSYGAFCGSKTPSVYTRIYPYLDWIESIVWPQY